jgi:REP element-mobilizing transposase RayT
VASGHNFKGDFYYFGPMSELRKTYEGGIFFITFTVVGWIDVFSRREYADELVKNLKFCQQHKGLEIYAWCIMTNHMHMIASSQKGKLSHILRDFKSYTASSLLDMIANNEHESRRDWMMYLFKYFAKPTGQQLQFWQHTNYATDLHSPDVIDQKLDYIHMNSVKAGYVTEPQFYPYSSAYPLSEMKLPTL